MADHLFRLIKGLSKNEKIYIKRNAALHTLKGEKNQYILLFDALDRMNTYDEGELKKHFSRDAFANSLSTGKNYLFNFILKNLEAYHKGVRAETRSSLGQAEILFELGLIDQCRKKVEKAESLAQKYSLAEEQYAIWNWKLNLPEEGLKSEKYFASLEKMRAEMDGNLNILKDLVEDDYELKLIYGKCRFLGKAGAKGVIELENFLAGLERKKPQSHWAFPLTFNHYQKLSQICFALNKPMKELVYEKKKLALLQENIHMIEVQPYLYALQASQERVFHLEFTLGYYDQLLESFLTLQTQCDGNPPHKKLLQLFPIALRFGACMRVGKFETAKRIIPKIRKFFENIDRSEGSESQKNKFILESAILNLALKDYAEALRCLDELIYGTSFELNAEIYYLAHFLQLLVYFEKGNSDLLEYRTRAVYRSLFKEKTFSHTEKLLLTFFKKQGAMDWDRKGELAIFIDLKEKLTTLFRSHPEEKKILNYFDILAWVESKIEGRSMSSILQDRYQKLFNSESGKQLIKYLSDGKS